MASKTDICNTALTRLGQEPITSFDENTSAAKRCSILFDEISDQVMASGEWTTLLNRQQLAKLTTNPEYGYSFQYQLPPDLIKLIEINNNPIRNIRFKRESDRLLVDEGTVSILYVKREPNLQLWGPHLTTAVSLKLTAELVVSLTGSASLLQFYTREYEQWLRKALSVDNQQASVDLLTSDILIDVR